MKEKERETVVQQDNVQPYRPPIPFPQRLQQLRNQEKSDATQKSIESGIQVQEQKSENAAEDTSSNPQKQPTQSFTPPPPFPQRLQTKKLDKQFSKFLDVFKKLHINLPFADALEQMPSYVKFMKEILSKKRKIDDFETVALTEVCFVFFFL